VAVSNRKTAEEQFGDPYVEVAARIEDLRAQLPPARPMESLTEDAAALGWGRGDVEIGRAHV